MGMGPALGRGRSEGQECFPGSLFQEGTKHSAVGSLGQSRECVDLAGDRPAGSEALDRTEDRKGRTIRVAQPQELLIDSTQN